MTRQSTLRLAALCAPLLTLVSPTPAQADTIGQVYMTAANFCRSGSFELDGSLLPIERFQTIYSVLQGQFGGDMRETVALPDMRGRSPVGVELPRDPFADPSETLAAGTVIGAETATLSSLPVHDHAETAHTHRAEPHTHDTQLNATSALQSLPSPQGNALASNATASRYVSDAPTGAVMKEGSVLLNPNPAVTTGAATSAYGPTGETGQGAPVDIRDPYVGLRFCIVLDGIYPSRN